MRQGIVNLVYKLCQWKGIISTFIGTFFFVLPILFRNNLHSPYHTLFDHRLNSSVRQLNYIHENDFQISLSNTLISSQVGTLHEDHFLSKWSGNLKFKLLVMIITTNRQNFPSTRSYNPKYLTQVIRKYWSIKLQRASSQLTDIKLIICDVDTTDHKEAQDLAAYLSKISVYNKNRHNKIPTEKYEKEKMDYLHCLNISQAYHSDYILVAEDDAMPHDDLLNKLDHLFSQRLPRLSNEFGYIKLFHPTRLNGYITGDINRLLEWLASAGLMEHLLTLFLYTINYDKIYTTSSRLIRYVYFILLFWGVGRINVIKWRTISPHFYRFVHAPSCCTPAMLFTPDSARQMVNYLTNVTCYKGFAKDTAMEVAGFTNWFFEPKLFTHIGVYSTLHKKMLDESIVD